MKALRITGIIMFVFILFCYLYGMSMDVPINSDSATIVIQAKDMFEGNVYLRDWYLSTGTYITTDLLLYTLFIPFLGYSSNIISVGSAVFYTGLVIICMLICAKNQSTFSYKRSFVAFSIVGIPNFFLASMALSGPLHISSLLYCLTALLIWEHAKRAYVKYGSLFIILTLVLIADPFALWFFVVPFSLACAIKAFRNRNEFLSLCSVIASYIISKLIVKLIGFNVPSIGEMRFVKIEELKTNVLLLVEGILSLFGANFFGKSLSVSTLIVILHLFVLFLLCLVVYRGYKRISKRDISTIEIFLGLGIVINVIEYVGSNMPVNLATTRYIIPAFVYLSIYLGKFLFERIQNGKMKAVVSIFLILFALTSLHHITFNKTVSLHQEAAIFLREKGMTHGYGSYWNSSIVTLESGDEVKIRPVIFNQEILPFAWLSKTTWYSEPANFLVFDDTNWGGINIESAEKQFGTPDHVYNFKNLTILHWDKDISKDIQAQ